MFNFTREKNTLQESYQMSLCYIPEGLLRRDHMLALRRKLDLGVQNCPTRWKNLPDHSSRQFMI